MMTPLPSVMLPVLVMFFTVAVTAADEMCGFLHNEAECDVMVASTTLTHIRATVNQCSKPVDVTFHITVVNTSWSWAHTFANRDEIRRVSGVAADAYLQVALEARRGGRLHVLAGFDVSSRPSQIFMDDSVKIHGIGACAKPTNPNAYLPLVVFIILLILIATLMATIVGFRRHRSHKRHSELLSNMEPSGTSYRDDPASTRTTVIKNDIYRDTVVSSVSDPGNDPGTGNGVGTGSVADDFRIRLPPPSGGGGGGARRKRLLKNGLPQPVLERLPEEPGEEEGAASSRETDAGINPSVNLVT